MKNCPKCNAEVNDLASQCPACGYEFPNAENTEETAATAETSDQNVVESSASTEKNAQENLQQAAGTPSAQKSNSGTSFNIKSFLTPKVLKIAGICVAAVAVLVTAIVLISSLSPKSFKLMGNYAVAQYEDDSLIVCADGKNIYKLSCDGAKSGAESVNGKAAYVVSEDDENVLYYFNGKSFKKVINEVNSDVEISTDGSKVIYSTGKGDDYTLWLYNGKSSSKIVSGSISGLTYSSDLSAIAYQKENEDGNPVAYYWDGSVHTLGKNRRVIEISPKAKYIYYSDTKSDNTKKYYVQKGDNSDSQQILSSTSFNVNVFNEDCSQLIYSDDDGKCYITEKGGEKKSLSMNLSVYNIVVPANAYTFSSLYNKFYISYSTKNKNYELVYLTKDDVTTIAKGITATSVTLSKDGKTVYYFKKADNNNKLYKAKATGAEQEPVKLASNVKRFWLTEDGNRVYYVNEDDELCSLTKDSDSKKVTDDYSNVVMFGNTLYYIKDEKLYFSKNGNKGAKVSTSGLSGEISNIIVRGKCLFVLAEDDIYVSANGTSFKKFCSAK